MRLGDLAPGQLLLDSRAGAAGENAQGIRIATAPGGTLRLEMADGETSAIWDSDPGLLRPGALHQAVFIVDGGPKVISVVVDGRLCDGGGDDRRPYGWGRLLKTRYKARFSDGKIPAREIADATGGPALRLGEAVRSLRIYGRALSTSEAIGNFRAGPP